MTVGSRVYHKALGYGSVLALAGADAGARAIVRFDGAAEDSDVDARTLDCSEDRERKYRVVRHYFRGGRPRTIERGLTLAEAQAHCSDPETSSTTATGSTARARTRRMGAWFDGYTDVNGR